MELTAEEKDFLMTKCLANLSVLSHDTSFEEYKKIVGSCQNMLYVLLYGQQATTLKTKTIDFFTKRLKLYMNNDIECMNNEKVQIGDEYKSLTLNGIRTHANELVICINIYEKFQNELKLVGKRGGLNE